MTIATKEYFVGSQKTKKSSVAKASNTASSREYLDKLKKNKTSISELRKGVIFYVDLSDTMIRNSIDETNAAFPDYN